MLGVTGCGKATEVVKEAEITVNTAPAQIQDLAKSVSYSGIVRGQNEVYLMPKVAARVTGIYVKAGDPVKAGQTLIILDNTDFIAGVNQAEAGLAMAQAGQRNNDLQVESAQADYERTKTLHESGAVSNQQLESARMKYEALMASSCFSSPGSFAGGYNPARKMHHHLSYQWGSRNDSFIPGRYCHSSKCCRDCQ
jgi:multidrug efflux pump subunit AcrA (membrane-fusion protein)